MGDALKYDKQAALRVVKGMDDYEQDIVNATRSLGNDLKSSGWKDEKCSEFCEQLSVVIQDIKNSKMTINAYKNHLSQKIRELE